jgi:hypothetical protein
MQSDPQARATATSKAATAGGRGRWVVIALIVAAVFLGVEAVEAVLTTDAVPQALRFAALHTVGVVVSGVLAILAVIAAIVLSRRLIVVLIGAVIAAVAVALFFV